MNHQENKKYFYETVLRSYGPPALIMLRNHLEIIERYEECQIIKYILIKYLGESKSLSQEVLDDWQSSFWNLGLSGEVAKRNLYSYFDTSLEEFKQKELKGWK